MRQIRQGVFETNSSSMHTVTLTNTSYTDDDRLSVDMDTNKVIVRFDEFGWGYDEYRDAETKLNYLITMIAEATPDLVSLDQIYESDDFKMVEQVVMDHMNCDGITIDDSYCSMETWHDGSKHFAINGYIDHQSVYGDIQSFINDWDINSVEDFIFNSNIELVIDNDNH